MSNIRERVTRVPRYSVIPCEDCQTTKNIYNIRLNAKKKKKKSYNGVHVYTDNYAYPKIRYY